MGISVSSRPPDVRNTDDTPIVLAFIQYPSTPLVAREESRNLPLLKGMFITLMVPSLIYGRRTSNHSLTAKGKDVAPMD
tara:strand:- start:344 stop:580 length:237 start_codon:yes stop_codon:yes gene_type:complete